MPQVIEGEGLKQDPDPEAVSPLKEYDITRYIVDDELTKMHDRYREIYDGLSKEARLARLEERMQEMSQFQISLRTNEARRFGYLTTIYALEKFADDGGVKIENLDFMEVLGLDDVDYLFAGANGFEMEYVDSKGHRAFYGMQNCTFGDVVAADHFGYKAKDCTIQKIEGDQATNVLDAAENISIRLVAGEMDRFGVDSKSISIDQYLAKGDEIGLRSRKMKIELVAMENTSLLVEARGAEIGTLYAFDSFGLKSVGISVRLAQRVRNNFGYKAERLQVESLVKAGDGAFEESISSRVGSVTEVGDRFGYNSQNFSVDKVQTAGANFGHGSVGLRLGEIEKTRFNFGRSSVNLRAARVGSAETSFGMQAEDFIVESVDEVKPNTFLHDATKAFVYHVGSPERFDIGFKEECFVIHADGKITTNLPLHKVQQIVKQRTGAQILQESLDLLADFEEEVEEVVEEVDDDIPF